MQTYKEELQRAKVVLPFANTTEGHFKQSFSGNWKSEQKPDKFEQNFGAAKLQFLMNSYEITASQLRYAETFFPEVKWSNMDWGLKLVKEISSNTVKSTFSIVVDLFDEIYIDQTLSIEFIFSITGEKSRDLLFEGNRTLQLTPIDTAVLVKERKTFKTIQILNDCHIYATLEVKTGEKDEGFGVDAVWQSSWQGGSDPELNRMHSDFGLHLKIEESKACGINAPITIDLFNKQF